MFRAAKRSSVAEARRDASFWSPQAKVHYQLCPSLNAEQYIVDGLATMPDRTPFPGRPAQPPGLTLLQYTPDGKRLNVAGCGNFARSFRTGDNGEPDMLMDIHEDTYAIASGVWKLIRTGTRLISVE